MGKRGADTYITSENIHEVERADEEEEQDPTQPFKKASEDVLKHRPMKTLKRHKKTFPAGNSDVASTNPNPFAGVALPTTPFSFNTLPNVTGNTPLFGVPVHPQLEKKPLEPIHDHSDLRKHAIELRSLNESFLAEVKNRLSNDSFVDLSSLCSGYSTKLSQVRAKDPASDNTLRSTNYAKSPSMPVSKPFEAPKPPAGSSGFTSFEAPKPPAGSSGIAPFTVEAHKPSLEAPKPPAGSSGFTSFEAPKPPAGSSGFTSFDAPKPPAGSSGIAPFSFAKPVGSGSPKMESAKQSSPKMESSKPFGASPKIEYALPKFTVEKTPPVFGTPAKPVETPKFFTESTPAFFGSKPVESETQSPFSFAKPVESQTQSPFGFGAKPAQSSSSFTAKPADPSISFGAKPHEETPKPFSFGAKPAEAEIKPFVFGSLTPSKPLVSEKPLFGSTVKPFGDVSPGLFTQPSETSPVKSSFGFGSPPFGAPSTGFSFGSATAVPVASSGFSFSAAPVPEAPKAFVGSFGTPSSFGTSFGSSAPVVASQKADEHDEGEGEHEIPDLPQLGDTLLKGEGEEDETTVHEVKAKILSLADGKWVTLGLGLLKLNRHQTSNKSRLLLRTSNGQVILNVLIFKEMMVKAHSDQTVLISVPESDGKLASRFIKVKARASVDALISAIDSAKASL